MLRWRRDPCRSDGPQGEGPKHPGGIERERRLPRPARALPHPGMAPDAVAPVDARLVGNVAGHAAGGRARNGPVRGTGVEGNLPPVSVAAGGAAGGGGRGRLGLLVRIMAHPARRVVGVLARHELGESPAHLVAAEALLRAGNQGVCRGIARGERGDLGREPVADDAVGGGLARHAAEPDPDAGGRVATALGAGRVGGDEAVGRLRVAREAFHLALERR